MRFRVIFALLTACVGWQLVAQPEITPAPKVLQLAGSGANAVTAATTFHLPPPDGLTVPQQRALAKFPREQSPSGLPVVLAVDPAREPIRHPGGFAIELGTGELRITGHDPEGLRYGLVTLNRLLRENTELPELSLYDWPSVPHISFPMSLGMNDAFLEFVAEEGRAGAGFLEFFQLNPVTGVAEEVDWELYREFIERCHRNGIRVSALPGYYLHRLYRQEKRGFCPRKDMPELLGYYRKALEAGADGLSWHFDDIFAFPAEVTHWKDCPDCSLQFHSLAQAQAWCLQQLHQLGREYGITMFQACPTLYSDHGTGNYDTSYGKLDPSLREESYFSEFCNFPGSEDFGFYYAYFDRDVAARLRRNGFKNWIWWNNGVWSGGHPEVFGAYISFPRLAYSWDFYDWTAMEKEYREQFDHDRYADLARIDTATDSIYIGSYDAIGIALGGWFAWNPAAAIADEGKLRAALFRTLFGPDGPGLATEWETWAKPLWIKSQKLIPFTAEEAARIPRLEAIAAALEENRRFDAGVYSQSLPQLPRVLATLRSFHQLLADWPEAAGSRLEAWRTPDALLTVSAAPQAPEGAEVLPLVTAGATPSRVRMNGGGALLFEQAKWNLEAPEFRLSDHSFSVIAVVTPTRFGNNYFTQLIGVRATYREYYPGFPGWGLGLDGPGQRIRFTVEDDGRNVDCVATAPGAVLANEVSVIVAVRDREQRELRLYRNGVLADRAPETGNGHWDIPGNIQIGYDNMGGGYFAGGLHALRLLDRALTEKEIAEITAQYHDNR